MSVKIKLKGVKETQVKFKKLADLTAVKQALKANTNDLQENAIRRMPSTYVKGYSTSNTAKNTNSYITNNGLTGKVYPLDNSAQGIYTIGDIIAEIESQT